MVKQIREANNWGNKITNLSYGKMKTSDNSAKKDTYIQKENLFNNEDNYYLTVNINRKRYIQNISVRLVNDTYNDNYLQLELLKIPAIYQENNEDIKTEKVELCFNPKNNFKRILFILTNPETDEDGTTIQDDYECYVVNNLVEENEIIEQVGIQSKSGFKFMIDGEKMEVGRTGIYEPPIDEYNINFLGVIDPQLPFIIDYKVKSLGGQE